MGTFSKAAKANQKVHRERSQPASRQHLGRLEKKKDYKVRARDFQKKNKIIKHLKQKAKNRNPDEFYYKMVNTRSYDGVHSSENVNKNEDELTPDQIKLIQSQDYSYVQTRRVAETKKIAKIKENMHLIGTEHPQRKHIIFFDNEKERKAFDPVKHFDTVPELVDRPHNRLRKSQLEKIDVSAHSSKNDLSTTLAEIQSERNKKLCQLSSHIERERKLHKAESKIQLEQKLARPERKKVVGKDADGNDIYKWIPFRRK